MRSADFPFLADWFAISLRWLALFGMALALSVSGSFDWLPAGMMVCAVLWNLFVSLNALQNRRLRVHRPLNLAVDAGVCLTIFFASGGLAGPLPWAGLLVIFSAGIYYEVRGALLAGFGLSALQFAGLCVGGLSAGLPPVGGLVLMLNPTLGLIFGSLSAHLMQGVRQTYYQHLRIRKEADVRLQQRERRRMQSLNRMFEILNATLDEYLVLAQALETSLRVLREEEDAPAMLAGAVLLSCREGLRIGPAVGMLQEAQETRFRIDGGLFGRALQTGTAQRVTDFEGDPELGGLESLAAFNSLLAQPLKAGEEVYGVLLFAHPAPDFFNADRTDLLGIISQQVVVCVQNARLFKDLHQQKERILSLQDEARKKLARDLHDGPTQSVAAIAMRLGVARRMLESSAAGVGAELERTEKLARQTAQEMRHLLFTMRPLVLEAEGLTAALESISTQIKDLYQQDLSVDVDPWLANRLEPAQQTALFYLVEEAVNNARKHAQATQILVCLHEVTPSGSLARLEIIDNGIGFDMNRVNGGYSRSGSLGMVSLRERAGALNGILNIDSSPGKGTRVNVLLPLTDQAAKRIYQSRVGMR